MFNGRQLLISPDCVFDASLVPETWRDWFVDSTGVMSQVSGEPRNRAPHRYLGNALVPAHRQALVATSPVRMDTRRRLGRLHQQEAQQGTALLADVS
jgi:hypothetical protein